jgi:hypothetical protein
VESLRQWASVCVAEGYDDNFSHEVGISLLLFYATCCLLHVVLLISPSRAQILYILRLARTVSRVKKLQLNAATLTSTPLLFSPRSIFITLNLLVLILILFRPRYHVPNGRHVTCHQLQNTETCNIRLRPDPGKLVRDTVSK